MGGAPAVRRPRPADPRRARAGRRGRPVGARPLREPLGRPHTEQREGVEALARGVAAKLLHDPIVELKERSEPGGDDLHAKLLIELLRLDPDDE